MDDWYPRELCPHCNETPTANRLDEHLITAHADLPDCTARYNGDDGFRADANHTCAMKHPHVLGEYGLSHASVCGPMGRTIWNDTVPGAVPHREQPRG